LIFVLINLYAIGLFSNTAIDSLKQLLGKVTNDSIHFELLNDLTARTAWNNIEEAITYATRFDSLANVTDIISRRAHAKKILGICYSVREYFDLSIEYYLASMEIYQEMKDTFNIGMLYNNIGSIYSQEVNYEKSLEYFQRAKVYFDATNDIEWQAIILQNIAGQYSGLENDSLALVYYLEAIKRYESEDAKANALNSLYNNRVCIILANVSTLLCKLEKWQQARVYATRALSLCQEDHTDISTLGQIDFALGRSHFGQKNYSTAENYFLKSLNTSKITENSTHRTESLEYLVKTYEQQQRYELAYQYQNKWMSIRDTIYNERIESNRNELREKYETEQKEKENQLLKAEGEVKDLQLTRVQQRQSLFIIGLLSLLIISALLFCLFKNNQKQKNQLHYTNQLLQQSLSEKESLLREIHHRVKNNLQMISSLLSLQGRRLNEKEGKAAFKASQSRIQSMALIHEKLYQYNDLSAVDLGTYLEGLTQQILDAYQVDKKQIQLKLDIKKASLDVDQLIPIGLIINELVCNSLKYAFPNEQKGEVKISFDKSDKNWILAVADNGVGMIEREEDASSFGMKLIHIFAKKLQAKLNILKQEGTAIQLTIPSNHLKLS